MNNATPISMLEQIMGRPEGKALHGHLADTLDAAVPLWIHQIKERGGPDDADMTWMKSLNEDGDLCLRMEYLFHKGPKPGDTAKVFNDTAKVIALMSFVPGGICLFGRRWESHKGNLYKADVEDVRKLE